MADVEIKYNNATIVSLNDSGTEVFETKGTFLTDDIAVEYTKSGGGVTLIASQEFTVSTSSTTAKSVGSVTGTQAAYTNNAIIYVRVRDKAGKRQGYFYGTDSFFINNLTSGGFNQGLRQSATYTTDNNFTLNQSTLASGYGVYPTVIYKSSISLYSRYNSNYTGAIDGTYVVDVYAITTPDGNTPYNYTAVQE